MTNEYALRPYQATAVGAAVNWIKYMPKQAGYVVAPGGSGKSLMIASVAQAVVEMGRRAVILARNEKLLSQNKAKLSLKYQAMTGIYCAGLGERDSSKPITVASIQSIYAMGADFVDAVLLCDECHNITAGDDETQYWQFFNAAIGSQTIGFTATAFRTSSGKLTWGKEIIAIPLAPLFEEGHLVPPVNRAPILPDLEQVAVNLGEYVLSQLEAVFLDPDLLHKTVEAIIRYCEMGQRNHVIIFAQSLKHCALLEAALRDNGITSIATVDGGTDKTELGHTLDALNSGEIKYLLNCQLLKEGIDIPNIDCVVVVRSTISKTLWEQMLYRGTRPAPNKKDFLVLDMGGNFLRHGGLGAPYIGGDGDEAKKTPPGKICPSCELFVAGLGVSNCSSCGYIFPDVAERKVHHDGQPDTQSSAVYGGMEYEEVGGVSYSIHINKKKGTKSIRVDYRCMYGNVSEWLSPFSVSEFARGKCWQFFSERGRTGVREMVDAFKQRMTDDELLELLVMECEHLKRPTRILVDKSEKFPRIKAYDYTPVDGGGLNPEGISALLVDDEIPF